MTDAIYCERCGGRAGECSCVVAREASVTGAVWRPPSTPPPDGRGDELEKLVGPPVLVAGLWARVHREQDGSFLVLFEGGDIPPFRGRGVPSEVLAQAAEHVRAQNVGRT